MPTKRRRTKNYAVPTNHEDFSAVSPAEFGLTPHEIQAAAILRGAMRNAQAIFGPGYRPLDIVCAGLPKRYVDNWAHAWLD